MVGRRTAQAKLDLREDVVRLLLARQTKIGDRLFESRLAQELGVSRQPVRNALDDLCAQGFVRRAPQRGYILDKPLDAGNPPQTMPDGPDMEECYRVLAADHLDGTLPSDVSEQELIRRYEVTPALLARVLARAAADGWATRKPGYGWTFSEVLRRADAYDELMRFRSMFEPAALGEIKPQQHLAELTRLRDIQAGLCQPSPLVLSQGELFRLGCEFHETLARLSGNSFALDTLQRLNKLRRLFIMRLYMPQPDYVIRHARDHVAILDLLLAGETHRAVEAMRVHLSR